MHVIRKEYLFVAGCCAVFFLLACLTWRLDPVISRDGVKYLEWIDIWYRNGKFQAIFDIYPYFWVPPFYLWIVKILISIGIPPEFAARGVNLFCGMMTPWIAYLIAQEVQNDKRVSLAAAALMALHPFMIELAIEVQRDMIYLALCGWCIYFCLRGIKRQEIWPWIPAGFFISCSILTRFETMEMIPLVFAAFLLAGFCKYTHWKRIAIQFIVLLGAFSVFFVSLLYVMGVSDHLLNYYQNYYSDKFKQSQSLYLEYELGTVIKK